MVRIILTIIDLKNKMTERHVAAYAAQSAYFMIMSFFPLTLLLLTLIGFTGLQQEELYSLLAGIIPEGFHSFMFGLIREMYSRTATTISLSALVAVWSAGTSFMALNRGMNSICQIKKKSNYLVQRIRGSIFAAFFVILIVLTLLLLVFGTMIHQLILHYFPFLAVITRVILAFRAFLMMALFILFFDMVYMTLPNRRGKFLEQLPGAIFTAIGWYVFSFGFSIYVENNNAFNMYGSLTTIIMLMLWLYFVMYIILIGALINEWLFRENDVTTPGQFFQNIDK